MIAKRSNRNQYNDYGIIASVQTLRVPNLWLLRPWDLIKWTIKNRTEK